MFAIVDIETTGGNASYQKIIEVAIVIFDGKKVTDSYQTLINPECNIPSFITALTGIDNEMVEDAPTFDQVADEILSYLENQIFVAHNVNFDYSFIKNHFQKEGYSFNLKKLCTVRLSRKLVPGLNSYSLKSLCQYFDIKNKRAHRAMADAEATTDLLSILIGRDPDMKIINGSLKRKREFLLPPNVPIDVIEKLPQQAGVYIFHDHNGKVIYVGKANEIKKRVKEHFSGHTHTGTKTRFLESIHDVTFEVTGSEFISLIIENELIKKHYPKYNKSNKKFNLNCGLYVYNDQNGYTRMSMGKVGKHDKPFLAFRTETEAISHILSKATLHGLCLRLCGVLHEGKCNYEKEHGVECGVCSGSMSQENYNAAFHEAFASGADQSFLIKTTGRHQDEEAYVMVEKGRFLGYGFTENDEISNWDDARDKLIGCYDTRDSQSIIKKYLKQARLIARSPNTVYTIL